MQSYVARPWSALQKLHKWKIFFKPLQYQLCRLKGDVELIRSLDEFKIFDSGSTHKAANSVKWGRGYVS